MSDSKADISDVLKLAGEGNPIAQLLLGLHHEIGRDVERDLDASTYWYRKSAEQGNESAQYHLGTMYENDEVVPKDEAIAYQWYLQSAEQGNVYAQQRLGEKFLLGQGFISNPREGLKWLRKAVYAGSDRKTLPQQPRYPVIP